MERGSCGWCVASVSGKWVLPVCGKKWVLLWCGELLLLCVVNWACSGAVDVWRCKEEL